MEEYTTLKQEIRIPTGCKVASIVDAGGFLVVTFEEEPIEECGDNRFKVISMAKRDILESTNIETSPDEMKVLDNFLFRCWQMGWLDRYEMEGGEE